SSLRIRFPLSPSSLIFFFFQAEDGIRDFHVTGVQTCALPIFSMPNRFGKLLTPRVFRVRSALIFQLNAMPMNIWGLPVKPTYSRSEERRVGKECRSRRSAKHYKKKKERRSMVHTKAKEDE